MYIEYIYYIIIRFVVQSLPNITTQYIILLDRRWMLPLGVIAVVWAIHDIYVIYVAHRQKRTPVMIFK